MYLSRLAAFTWTWSIWATGSFSFSSQVSYSSLSDPSMSSVLGETLFLVFRGVEYRFCRCLINPAEGENIKLVELCFCCRFERIGVKFSSGSILEMKNDIKSNSPSLYTTVKVLLHGFRWFFFRWLFTKNEKWKTGYSVDKEEAGVYGVSWKEGFFDNQRLFSLFLSQILKKSTEIHFSSNWTRNCMLLINHLSL